MQGDPTAGIIILLALFAVYFLPSVCAIRFNPLTGGACGAASAPLSRTILRL